ncbi:cyclic nucleotide-binding domain-containing protein 2-like [Eleutherodactylus coqui]|uniref:cyclic nucleotide-binding domain-containing protein 2-like n=1 Tax=Eleutherodactylus coqui TaxID=57060 RepID=UPI0034633E28
MAGRYKTLKRIAKDIKTMCIVCKVFRQKLKGLTEFQILRPREQRNDIGFMEDEIKERKFAFDHTLFKTGQDQFPRKAERITLKRPEWRTEIETKFLCSILQRISSYRQYSNHLQMLLAKVLRMERFGRGRVIIKKGHTGSSFYFIYSGCVAICNDKDGISAFVDREPILLHAGTKFGDIALIQGQRRNSTVVCMEETVMLVVDKEDFFSNKLDVELQKECECRFTYFRSLDIFSQWPLQHIKNISESCQTSQYMFDQVVIQDSRESDNIAFITEGTCEVLRLVNLTMCPSYHKWLQVSLPCVKASAALPPTSIYDEREEMKKKERAKRLKCLTDENVTKSSHRHIAVDSTPEGLHDVVAAAVYMHIDLLHQKEFFGFQDNQQQERQKDHRGLVLVSKGCKIIHLKKATLKEFCDPETTGKLQKYHKKHPSDDTLCKIFLQHNDWEIFKKHIVSSLVKPITTNRYEKEKKKKQIYLYSSSTRQAGTLDLSSVSFDNQNGTYVTQMTMSDATAQHFASPQSRNVQLVHAITVPVPKMKDY